jgi:hypothetical protein
VSAFEGVRPACGALRSDGSFCRFRQITPSIREKTCRVIASNCLVMYEQTDRTRRQKKKFLPRASEVFFPRKYRRRKVCAGDEQAVTAFFALGPGRTFLRPWVFFASARRLCRAEKIEKATARIDSAQRAKRSESRSAHYTREC